MPMHLVAQDETRMLKRIDEMADIAVHGDADARGNPWYDFKESSEDQADFIKDSSASFSRSVPPYLVNIN